jgi:coenzyme F420 hydrogenase subunit beta
MNSILEVVKTGVCVGCGACSVVTEARIQLSRNKYSCFVPDFTRADLDDLKHASSVCPMADEALNEDQISAVCLSDTLPFDRRIGRYRGLYAGRVIVGEDLAKSSSGGMTTWLLIRLLKNKIIDGVIHVSRGGKDGLFCYSVSYDADTIRANRKSQYYTTNFADVIRLILGDGKSYAFVGVPCFVKALRLLTLQNLALKSQIKYLFGLVCGHLKSGAFAEILAWQVGIAPADIGGVDFRVKEVDKPSNDYSFGAWVKGSNHLQTKPVRSLIGGNWGHALFQLRACDYCDDIFAETADVVFGDAWLKEYTSEWRGTNIVIVRNSLIDDLLTEGKSNNEIMLDSLTVKRIAHSQEGNFRHRWDGLSVRLEDAQVNGAWVPKKRIKAGERHVSKSRRRIIRIRQELAGGSHELFLRAKDSGSLALFDTGISPLIESLDREYRSSWVLSVRRFLGHTLRTYIKWKE